MSGSVNKAILVGNVGKDPEVRTVQDGTKVVNFSLATSERWRDKSTGEQRERTEWHRVVIFNEGLAKIAEQYVRKGSSLYIEGAIQTRKWTDQSGAERYSTEIVLQRFRGELALLGARSERDDAPQESGSQNARPAGRAPTGSTAELDDEIPF